MYAAINPVQKFAIQAARAHGLASAPAPFHLPTMRYRLFNRFKQFLIQAAEDKGCRKLKTGRIYSEWFEPRSINSSGCVITIVWLRVVSD